MSMTKKFYLFALQLQVTLLHVQSTHYILVSLSYPHHVIATSQPKPRSTLTNQLFLQHN